jgi:trk system potassium uptake protein TrkH
MALVFFTFLILCAANLDLYASLNLALLSLGNIGLGLGQSDFGRIIYALPSFVKGWLCFIMLTGRLELMTVFALLAWIFGRR